MSQLKLVLVLSVALMLSNPVCAAPSPQTQSNRLEAALKIIDKDPARADAALRAIDLPTAKVFRAYLYFIKKVPVANVSSEVDRLMNEAIAEVPDPSFLGEVVPTTKYHYKDLKLLLSHMRFINDASDQVAIPGSIFRFYPLAAFEAFAPYWGSLRDGFLSVDDDGDDAVLAIPEVKQFHEILSSMCGSPADFCQGTMRYMYYRKRALALMKTSLAPAMFLPDKPHARDNYDPDLNNFAELWSNGELWNKVMYEQYMLTKGRAQRALSVYYAKRLKVDAPAADECSKNAIECLAAGHLDEYSHGDVKSGCEKPLYKICIKPGVTGTDLEREFGKSELSPDDLTDGLRYCILNNGDVSSIDWFIKRGVRLEEGTEPPLFSAVKRPDVMEALLKAGAKADHANTVGKTALFQAAQFDALLAVKLLHRTGVNINQKMVTVDSTAAQDANSACTYNYTVGGRTPLHYAAMFASADLINYLLDNGADKDVEDSAGKTAFSMVEGNSKLSAAEKVSLRKRLE